jgi:hypothetical protein
MIKPSKNKVASESFVYGVVGRSEDRLEGRIGNMEDKMESRFNKVMTALVNIAGQFKKFDEERTLLSARSKNHSDRIEKLESTVFPQ